IEVKGRSSIRIKISGCTKHACSVHIRKLIQRNTVSHIRTVTLELLGPYKSAIRSQFAYKHIIAVGTGYQVVYSGPGIKISSTLKASCSIHVAIIVHGYSITTVQAVTTQSSGPYKLTVIVQ